MGTRSAMASVRKHALNNRILKEKERIINSFASFPSVKHRATIKVTRQILLNGPYLLNGKSWEVKSKSLGAGVYELSLKRQEGE